MKFENKKLLIFDLDGTLINSALDLALAINYMLKKLDHKTFDEHKIHGWVGNGALILVQRALSADRIIDTTLDELYVQKALKIFLDYYEKNLCNATVPYENVISTLKILKQKYTLTIVTNKPYDFVEPILNGLKMNNLFTLILGGDSLSKKKPDAMPLMYVCAHLHEGVENCVMIGDSKNDILAANACNMDSIGVTYGYNYSESIGVHNPTVIIDNFLELLELL